MASTLSFSGCALDEVPGEESSGEEDNEGEEKGEDGDKKEKKKGDKDGKKKKKKGDDEDGDEDGKKRTKTRGRVGIGPERIWIANMERAKCAFFRPRVVV